MVVVVVVVTAAVADSCSVCGSGVAAAGSAVHCGYSYFCSTHQPSWSLCTGTIALTSAGVWEGMISVHGLAKRL